MLEKEEWGQTPGSVCVPAVETHWKTVHPADTVIRSKEPPTAAAAPLRPPAAAAIASPAPTLAAAAPAPPPAPSSAPPPHPHIVEAANKDKAAGGLSQ